MKPTILLPVLLLVLPAAPLHAASATRGEADQAYDRGDYAAAFRLYLAGARRGEPEAERKLGYFYMNGLGVEKDEQQGRLWIEKAAEHGNAEAQLNMGAVYYNGLGVPVDHIAAYKWLNKAATGGIVDAQAKLGEMFANGIGTPADDAQAVYWYGKAVNGGHARALDKLLDMKVSGRLPESEYNKFLASLKASAAAGDARAQSRLAAIYCTGLGVSVADKSCEEWLRKAAGGGDVLAQRNLGVLLMNWQGKGVPGHQLSSITTPGKNGGPATTKTTNHDRGPQFTEAVLWFEKAARQFDAEAFNNLGFMVSQGFGAEKDIVEGYKWWLLSAAQGNMEARSNITRARGLLTEEQRQEAQRRAAAYGDPYASAASAAGKAARASDVDAAPPAGKPDGKSYAIVIGIEKYRMGESDGMATAVYAERDARAMRDHLPSLGYPANNIIYLAGEDATRAGIQKYLEEWLTANIEADSTVLIYFAGNGASDPVTGEAHLLPWDGNMRSLSTTAFARKDILDTLERLRARRIIVMLDAGFSGAGSRSASNGRPLVSRVRSAQVPSSIVTVLTAARDDQSAGVAGDQGHGLFSYFLLRALRGEGAPSRATITAGDVHGYLKPLVEAAARRQNRDQTPELIGSTAQPLGRRTAGRD